MFRKRNRSLTFESLEERKVLSANSIALTGDVLHIRGTNRDDVISVERVTSGPNLDKVQVTLNNRQEFFDYDYNGTGTGSIAGVVIQGRRGNDQITIADNVYFPAVITGGRGNDTITSGVGNDVIDGGRGEDRIFSTLGDDTVDGGKGNDWIDCGLDNDRGIGGTGNDAIWGGFQDDFLDGGTGDDFINGEEGNDNIFGQAGNDAIEGFDGSDIIDGGVGNDVINAGMNTDIITGGAGNDTIDAGEDNDYVDGGLGNDNILGGAGDDQLKGGLGVDTLNGEAGNNLLDNEAESDVLLNGVVTDLDREFVIEFGVGGQSIAQFDLQNINGQVVEKFSVEAHNLAGQSQFDVLVTGLPAVQIAIDSNGDGSATFSTDPTGTELPFPLNAPPIGAGTAVGAASQLGGSVVKTFVI